MKQFFLLTTLLFVVCGPSVAGEHADRFWKADDVHVGMNGTGRTVLKGNEIEEFQFEVIGVLKNVFPKQDIFLVRLSGLGLEETGVIQGMSGSPLYIDGKLLGAVAYAWMFSKEPIAGVTPAEYMYHLIAEAAEPKDGAARPKPQGLWNLQKKASRSQPRMASADLWHAAQRTGKGPPTLRHLRAPLVISGCPQTVFGHYSQRFEQMGMLPVQGGGAGLDPRDNDAEAGGLVPGAPVAVSFMEGDMTIAGIGTVTDRVGDEIIAFGHPMMELGRVELPMATARVDAVIPSLLSSFKLSTARKTVGTLLVDRSEGVYGRTGKLPSMVPVSVKVNRGDFPGEADYNYRVADTRHLTPLLVDIGLFSSLYMKGRPPLEYTLYYKVKIVTDKDDVIQLRDMASSASRMSMWGFFGAVTSTVDTLMNNPFEPARITRVEAEVEIKLGDRAAVIDSVRLLNVKAAPGKSARVNVRLRRYRQASTTVTIEVPIPADLPEGVYDLLIGDARAAEQAARNAAPSEFDPENYNEMLKLLRMQYPNDEIYALILLPQTGLNVRGTPLKNLPSSYLSMLTPVGRSKNELIGAVQKTSLKTEYQIIGSQNLQLLVEKED